MRRIALIAAAFIAAGIMWPPIAHAPTATDGRVLQRWQAVRVARSHADLQGRDRYRVVRAVRVRANAYRLMWHDSPYLEFGCQPACFDEGWDVVEERHGQFWLRDGQISGGVWMRFL